MGTNNGKRFLQSNPNFTPASGVIPVPRVTLNGPATSPPGHSSLPTIRIARPQDAKFLVHLQKKFSNELGFLSGKALNWYIAERRVGLVLENGEPAGYILGRTHYKYAPLIRPITQTAVAMDAQRRHLGLALVARICQQAVDARQLVVQAVCAADLDANEFWLAAGFEPIAALNTNNTRKRELFVWRKQLIHTRPEWFMTPPTTAGNRVSTKAR